MFMLKFFFHNKHIQKIISTRYECSLQGYIFAYQIFIAVKYSCHIRCDLLIDLTSSPCR